MSILSVNQPELAIYGLRCTCHQSDGVRYVGKASRSVADRFDHHKSDARKGSLTPVYVWMREHGIENVYAEVLIVAENLVRLDFLEKARIEHGLNKGELLLNVSGKSFATGIKPKLSVDGKTLNSIVVGLRRGFGCKYISDATGVDEMLLYDLRRRFCVYEPVITWGTAMKRIGAASRFEKLDDARVVEILGAVAGGVDCKRVAVMFGVSVTTVYSIRDGRTWKHISRTAL
jgi:hypothetical protein